MSDVRYSLADFTWFEPEPEAPMRSWASRERIGGFISVNVYTMLRAFEERGWYKAEVGDGKHTVTCPWYVEHTNNVITGADDTSTVLYTNGDGPGFKCKHAHCDGRTVVDVKKLLGLWREVAPATSTSSTLNAPTSTQWQPHRLRLVRLSEIAMLPVPWLWPGYLARGAVNLLVGDPDNGKTLVALDLAARLTTGAAFPDGLPNSQPAADVIVLSAEDSMAYTIRPRVEAAGGDSNRVHVLAAESAEQGLSISSDITQLGALITEIRPALVIIDPMSAYLPGIDTYRDNEVRATLAPFVALAQRHGVTVLGIIHMSKNTERNAMQRVLGSTAFTALSRATFMVSKDPDDHDRRLFLPVKFNLGKRPAGFAFRPTGVEVRTPDGLKIGTARAVWEDTPVKANADEVLRQLARGSSPSKEAEGKIREALRQGPALAREIEELSGLAETTLRRVRERIGSSPSATRPTRWPAPTTGCRRTGLRPSDRRG
jgi:putative DNA primase/helicase